MLLCFGPTLIQMGSMGPVDTIVNYGHLKNVASLRCCFIGLIFFITLLAKYCTGRLEYCVLGLKIVNIVALSNWQSGLTEPTIKLLCEPHPGKRDNNVIVNFASINRNTHH